MAKKFKRRSSAGAIPAGKVEFNPDYTPVKRDLKRIGLLAGIFVVIMVVLSFFQDSLISLFIK